MNHASTLSDYFNGTLDELSGRKEIEIEQSQTLAAHLKSELR